MAKIQDRGVIMIVLFGLALLAAVTVPHDLLDVTDVKDYSDTAKFFAGEYSAKQRSSHSILYGWLLGPIVRLSGSFWLIKFASVFWIVLTIVSLYYISGKNRKTLILFVLSPFIWYMAPWLNPVPIIGFLFLWAYFFIKRFELQGRIRDLFLFGLCLGLSIGFWDTALYFSVLYLVAFFYNKKLYHLGLVILSILIGLIPKFLLDFLIYGIPVYGIGKNFLALISFALSGGIYNPIYAIPGFRDYLILLPFIPFYFYLIYKRSNFVRNRGIVLFLTLSLLFILFLNPQIRVLLAITPILILLLGGWLNTRQFRKQAIIFGALSILVVTPYLAQINYDTNAANFEKYLAKFPDIEYNDTRMGKLIAEDLEKIEQEFSGESFVVGNKRDNYRILAHYYWGEDIEEFISIEDYELFLAGEDVIATKRVSSQAGGDFRREIWIEVGIGKNPRDVTDYESVKYGLSLGTDLNLEGFEFVKEYGLLRLFEKS
jgi:hypothetical protein